MKVLHVIDKLSMDGVNPSSCTVLFGGWSDSIPDTECKMAVLSLANDQLAGAYLSDRGVEVLYTTLPKYSPKTINEICRLISERDIDIVHLHGYGAAHFGRIAARRSNIKNIVHEHAFLRTKPQHFVIDWLLRNKTDLGVAVSESVREFMIKGRCVPVDRVRVVGNGVDLKHFGQKTIATTMEARKLIGVEPGSPVFGTVTRFREEKGNEYLISAFERIHDRVENARLVVIGDGELRESLRSMAVDLGIDGAIQWLGFRADVEKIMPAFDVHIIPSLTEGFPLALAEGMAIGNAMVVTNVGGMKEIGTDGENVVFVPPRDAAAIADACVRLIEDERTAKMLAANARVTAMQMSIGQSAQNMLDLYRELVPD